MIATPESRAEPVHRDERGRFAAGGPSANPGGRPAVAGEFRRHLEADLAKVIEDGDTSRLQALCTKLVDDALAGNPHAQRFVLERIAPVTTYIESTMGVAMTAEQCLMALGESARLMCEQYERANVNVRRVAGDDDTDL